MNAAERIRAAPLVGCHHALSQAEWAALSAHPAGCALVALWADTTSAYALMQADEPLLAACPVVEGRFPTLSAGWPGAAPFERMVADLWGHHAVGAADARPMLDHGHWGMTHPMAPRPGPAVTVEPFAWAASAGSHQFGLGPVGPALAEPVHLRIHATGEAVDALEARRGYAHKGTLLLMRSKSPRAAARYAARIQADSTAAHALAFATAAEAASGAVPPPRAAALRRVALAIETLTHRLRRAEDASPRLGHAREAVMQACHATMGHRMMMDWIVPGGLVSDLTPAEADALAAALDTVPPPFAEAAAAAIALLDGLPPGSVGMSLPVASGEGLGCAAGPRGTVWHWLRLDAGTIAASFVVDPSWAAWAALEAAAPGTPVDGLPALQALLDPGVSGADL